MAIKDATFNSNMQSEDKRIIYIEHNKWGQVQYVLAVNDTSFLPTEGLTAYSSALYTDLSGIQHEYMLVPEQDTFEKLKWVERA